MTDPQYAAMAAEDLPCWCPAKGNSDKHKHYNCPAYFHDVYIARLQSVATASHKAGAEAMREKAANIGDHKLYGHQAADAIRALSLPTGEP